MRKSRFISFVIAMAALTAVIVMTAHRPAQAQGQNLLTNPSFEGAYSSFTPQTDYQSAACALGVCTTAQMPAGWFPWWVPQKEGDEPWENRMPEYKPVCPFSPCPFPDRLKGGEQALQYFTFHSTHLAGIWQRVSVPAGSKLHLQMWGQAWSSATDKIPSDFPTPVNMRIGIDPTGGTNPFSPSIIWSGTANPYDTWFLFEVDATAQGNTVTVFTWSQPQEARKHNDIYWDEASLTVGGAGSPAPASGGGAPASSGVRVAPPGPTPTPNANGDIILEVQPGDTLWSIAARAGLSLDELLALNNLSRDDFIKPGDQLLIGSGNPSAGTAEQPADESAATSEETTSETTTEETAAEPTAEATAEPTPEATEEPASEVPAPETVAENEEGQAVAAAPESEPEVVGGTICLRAFEDTNQDGIFSENEPLKRAVAFTIANGQSVVSNYITTGESEPYCIEGLAAGTYRVSRSFAADEVGTSSGDWAVSLTDGAVMNLDFGSKEGETAPAAEDTTVTVSESTELPADAVTAEQPAAAQETGTSWSFWAVVIVVALAAVLLIGVTMVVLSARRVS